MNIKNKGGRPRVENPPEYRQIRLLKSIADKLEECKGKTFSEKVESLLKEK